MSRKQQEGYPVSEDGKKDNKHINSGISLFKHSHIMKLSISVIIKLEQRNELWSE